MKKDERPEENSGDIEFMDLEEEERSVSQNRVLSPKRGEGEWKEEPEEVQPWKITVVFAVLAIFAALIVMGLWMFTHRGKEPEPDGGDAASPVSATETPEGFEEPSDGLGLSPENAGPGSGMEDREPGETPLQSQEPSEAPSQEPEISGAGTENPGAGTGNPEAEPGASAAEPGSAPDVSEPQDGNGAMSFEAVSESVTPKDVVNLRSVPSTAEESSIVTQVKNGEVLSRVGVNPDTGWSAIDYDGRTLYAVTQYLTVDLSYKTPVTPSDPNRISTLSGRVIIFSDCDDQVTPKEYVNLRTEPSTTEGDATVSCQVSKGENLHRTGISPDSGWSRVEYNGQILYVVSSLLQAAQ